MIFGKQLLKNAGLLSIRSASFEVKVFGGNPNKKKALGFAHLTDVHIEPELNAPAGLANVFTICKHKTTSHPSVLRERLCLANLHDEVSFDNECITFGWNS